MPKFTELAFDLYKITGNADFAWDEAQEQAFRNLKAALVSSPVLAFPRANGIFIFDTDASGRTTEGDFKMASLVPTERISYACAANHTQQ